MRFTLGLVDGSLEKCLIVQDETSARTTVGNILVNQSERSRHSPLQRSFVGRRFVDGWNRHIVQAEVDTQLATVVNQVVQDEVAKYVKTNKVTVRA